MKTNIHFLICFHAALCVAIAHNGIGAQERVDPVNPVEKTEESKTAKAADAVPAGKHQRSKIKTDYTIVAEFDKADENGGYHATVSMGTIPAGKQASVELVLKNLTDEEIKFSRPAKKCKCSQFKSNRHVIPPHDQTIANLLIKIPTRKRTKTAFTDVKLPSRKKGEVPLSIKIEYELSGLLGFSQPLGVLLFEDESPSKTIELPLIYTAPVDLSNLEVTASDNLPGIEFEVIPSVETGILRATVDQSVLANGNVRGEIYISDPQSGQRDICYLSVKDKRQSEISPRIIRFQKNEDGLVATAIVRTATLETVKTATGDQVESSVTDVKCFRDGKPLDVKTRRLGKTIVRVELMVNADAAKEFITSTASAPSFLSWQISKGGSSTEVETPFVVDEH